jgi:hypothetical protein
MDCKLTSIKARIQKQAGVTIAEFLVALGIAGVILGQVCLLWLYSSRSFAAQMSYVHMDQHSQRALDTLTQSIRQCKSVTNFTTTRLTLIDYDDKPLTFAFENGELRSMKGNATPKTLLRDCKSGQFAIYQRSPIAGALDQYPATNPFFVQTRRGPLGLRAQTFSNCADDD